jgi:hypothetical protein
MAKSSARAHARDHAGRASRSAAKIERKPADAPVRPYGYDSDDLIGESQYSADQAGERAIYVTGRSGGPPDRDPFTYTPDDDLGRRGLEDATEAPAQDRFEPAPDAELEPELGFSGEEEEWTAEEVGPVEADEEPDDRELLREEQQGRHFGPGHD